MAKRKVYNKFKVERYDSSKLTFSEGLEDHLSYFEYDIQILRQVNKIVAPLAARHYDDQRKQHLLCGMQLSEPSKTQFMKWFNFLPSAKVNQSIHITDRKASDIIDAIFEAGDYSTRIPIFIREMSIVYLVASFEDFLANVMRLTLCERPQILKLSDKKIDYKHILDHTSLPSLLIGIISDEVSAVFFKDIEEISDYLGRRFCIDLSQQRDWQKFKEVFYRRNLVIHNNLKPNEIYRNKTGYKGKEGRLTLTDAYLTRSFTLFQKYSEVITRHFDAKFAKA